MKQKIVIFLLIFLIAVAILFTWWNQAVKPPDPTISEYTSFSIQRGENSRDIAENLHKNSLIRSPIAFFLLARFGGLGDKIQSGNFSLSPSMDLFAIADTLTHGTDDVRITVIEGWRNEEVALVLARELGIPESEFLKHAKIGYMFPDTYLLSRNSEAEDIVRIFLDTFQKKVTKEIISRAGLKGLDTEKLVTIASLIEREAKLPEDRPIVASVILNRLKIGMKLDIDASVQYALGYQSGEKSWWKKDLTYEDLEIDSSYNTYKNPGLPPNPICNPGLSVIEAVVNAPDTNYLYYISDNTGKLHFSENIEGHNENIDKYLK